MYVLCVGQSVWLSFFYQTPLLNHAMYWPVLRYNLNQNPFINFVCIGQFEPKSTCQSWMYCQKSWVIIWTQIPLFMFSFIGQSVKLSFEPIWTKRHFYIMYVIGQSVRPKSTFTSYMYWQKTLVIILIKNHLHRVCIGQSVKLPFEPISTFTSCMS